MCSAPMILDFKYRNKTYFCRYVAQIMSEKMELENLSADYLLFVPLHKKRLRKRGFNQAQKIAEEWNINYYETSALKNTNCKAAFLEIAKIIIPKIKKATLNITTSQKSSRCCKCIII